MLSGFRSGHCSSNRRFYLKAENFDSFIFWMDANELATAFERYDQSQRQVIVQFVANIYQQGACVRCALRFLCLHSIQLFNNSEEQLVELFHSLPDVNGGQLRLFSREFSPCTICLGILQDNMEKRPMYQQQVADALAKCGYEYKSFQFCVTLPFASIVREMAAIKSMHHSLG